MRPFFRSLFTIGLLGVGALVARPAAAQRHTLRFTSADEDAVTFSSSRIGMGSFSYELWVNYSAPAPIGSFNTLVEFDSDQRALYMRGDGTLTLYGGSTSVNSNGPVGLQDWHHVACTYNDITTQCTFYIDGFPAGTALSSFPNSIATEVGIGSHFGDTGWQGELDEVIIWNSARTQAQVLADKAGLVAGTEPELIAYYKFDNGAGQIVTNRRAAGPDAVLGQTTAVEQRDPQWTNNNAPLAAPAAVAAPATALSVYPNPATTTAHVSYTLREATAVRLLLLDATGRLVATLHDGAEVPGAHTAELPAGLPAGVYTCRLTAGTTATAQRLVLTE